MATTITPFMALAPLAARVPCSNGEAAWVLLELLADGHLGRDLDALPQAAVDLAWDQAWRRMDLEGVAL
jgi:hypothetical protein